MDHRHVRRDRPQENELLAREGTRTAAEIVGRRGLQPFHHLGGQQRLYRYEGDAQSSREISKGERKTTRVNVDDCAVVPGAIDAADRTEAVQRPSPDDDFRYQTGAHQQIRLHAHHTLRKSEVLLPLTDDFVSEDDGVTRDRKSAQGDVRAVGDASHDFGNALDLIGHVSRFQERLARLSGGAANLSYSSERSRGCQHDP